MVITERDALKKLTSAPEIKHVILTGGTETAQAITRANPTTPLSAETGGKNVMILTASADRDHAIMNACASAFGNAGQKCSACSLLLVERSVYESEEFRIKLKDCATSMKVGSVWKAGNIVGPMITNENEKLLKALNTLEPGESWLVAPRFVDKKKYILAPTVKWGVSPKNFSFRTELFGPMLSVCPFDTLQEAIDLGADCLVTGEAAHHIALLAKQKGVGLVVAGHWGTEHPIARVLAEQLAARLDDTGRIAPALTDRDPYDYL